MKPYINWGGSTEGLTTVVAVHCSPSGDVLSVSVTRSSGNEAWDQAVVGAVERAAPLPPDNNGQTPPNIRITFHASDAG